MRASQWFSAAVLLLAAQALQAQGITMVQQETRDGKSTTVQVQLDPSHIKAETHASGNDIVALFDGQNQVLRLVNMDTKSYNEITKAQLDQMKQMQQRGAGSQDQMSAAQQQQIQDKLNSLPPAQRALAEQMLKARGATPAGPATPTAIQYHQTGSDKVGSWTCTKYDGMRGGEKVSEVCAVDPSALGLKASDFEVARQLAEFLKSIAPQAADQAAMFGSGDPQGFSGVPVRHVFYANGKVTSSSELKEIQHQSLPASTFDVPAGFTKQTMGMGAGARP